MESTGKLMFFINDVDDYDDDFSCFLCTLWIIGFYSEIKISLIKLKIVENLKKFLLTPKENVINRQ